MISYLIPDIKHIRTELKLTQADLAVFLGVSRVTFIKWEKHPGEMPIAKYSRLADEYNRMKALTNV